MDLHRLILAFRGFLAAKQQSEGGGNRKNELDNKHRGPKNFLVETTANFALSENNNDNETTTTRLSAAAVNEPSSRPEITMGQQTAAVTLVIIGGGRRRKKKKKRAPDTW